jgi:hypothetical protein
MTRLLVALYPREWRETFGDELAALLEETRLTPAVIIDVAIHAARLRVGTHRRLTLVLVSLLWSACFNDISVHARLTANILWAPSNPERALALLATTGPWLALAVASLIHYRSSARDPASNSTAA